ncbi:MAG: FtsW/RodA/SpoVE family cell cycle protein, partial [Oligoflexus sp.]
QLDPQDTGYHALQSLIAVGSGGLFGKGYMQGTQAHLRFLPERHTDFIFSVFAEEHGFWGSVLVFVGFGLLAYIALDIAKHSKDTFSGLLAIGLGTLIFLEFIINVAMVMGIFPVVGIPLPFFSYGSSAMLTICVSLGLLISINRTNSGVSKR